MAVKPIPEGYHTITPYLVVDGASELIEFVKKAFGAEEGARMPMPGGKIGHAEVKIGDSHLMLADANPPDQPARTGNLHLYVKDVDATFKSAVAAGAKAIRQPENQFYGDRISVVSDRWGNSWSIGTHIEDVTPEEMKKRMANMKPK